MIFVCFSSVAIRMPNQVMNLSAQDEAGCPWQQLPDSILLQIFTFLPAGSILQCAQVARYSAVPLKRCQFSQKYQRKTPHISPIRARYWVSFVDPASDWYSASVPAMINAILTKLDRDWYNGTGLYCLICLLDLWKHYFLTHCGLLTSNGDINLVQYQCR